MKKSLIDHVEFNVRAGNGGKGIVHFRREKYIAKGGPDGGDGGNGGSIYFVANPHVTTLVDFAGKVSFEARNGEAGRAKRQHGKDAEDIILEVPVGTVVWQQNEVQDDEAPRVSRPKTRNVIIHGDDKDIVVEQPKTPVNESEWTKFADMNESGMKVLIARGGAGGRGNDAFKSSTNTTPQYSEPGQFGEKKVIKLELKILADIGLVGLPNAGKSTLLSVLTNARPEIANYPFTTLSPNLGVIDLTINDERRQLVVADIPGLIEDAHKGKGLGIDFLRHIERCRVLVYVISPTEEDLSLPEALPSSLVAQFNTVLNEVKSYGHEVDLKPHVTVVNKIDVLPEEQVNEVKAAFKQAGEEIIPISAAAHMGIEDLRLEVTNLFLE